MSAPTKETIYLFTTTRNSLYKRDLLNVCCFADGWVVEFGYKPEYVPQPLLSNPSERLEGHPVVIVFCEVVNEGDIYYRYFPVRKGIIGTPSKDFSDCLTLPITLGHSFDYSSADSDKRVEEFQKFVNDSPHRPRTLKSEHFTQTPNIFVRSATDCFTAESWQRWDRYWYPLAAKLCGKKGLSDAYFIRLDPEWAEPSSKLSRALHALGKPGQVLDRWLGDVLGRGRAFPSPVIGINNRPKWALVAGVSYELRLEVKTKAKPPHHRPSVTPHGEVLHVVGPFERQSGDGTRVEYVLAPKRSFQQEHCLFEVRVEQDKDGNSRSSEIGGVLDIAPRSGLLFSTMFCLVVGTLLLSLDTTLLEDWFGKPDGVRWWHGKTALAIAKTLGLILVSVGSFLGFRKLPAKS